MKYIYILTYECIDKTVAYTNEKDCYYELLDVVAGDKYLIEELNESWTNRNYNEINFDGEFYFGVDGAGYVKKIELVKWGN